MNRNFIHNLSRRTMIGFHIPDYDQFDDYESNGIPPILSQLAPAALVKSLKKADVQMFWFYYKCHRGNSYYPSKVGHVHSAMGDRDIFGEFTEACLSEGIVPGAVYEVADYRIMKDKPEWCHRVLSDTTSTEIDETDAQQGTTVAGACINGPYGDYVIEQTLEVAKKYPIKAFYLDFLGLFNFGQWICPYCGPKFKKEFGFDFTGIKDMTHKQYVDYVNWHYRQNDLFTQRLNKKIKDINPDILFTHNFHGTFPAVGLQRSESAERNCDFVTGDLFHLRSGMLQMSWKLRQYAALSKCFPGEALLDYTGAIGEDSNTPKALDSYRAELMTGRSVNVNLCSSLIARITGEKDNVALSLIEKVFKEQKSLDPWFEGMQPLYDVGIVRSQKSIEFHPDEIKRGFTHLAPGANYSSHDLEFEGWCQALIQAHSLWDVVSDHQVTYEYLSRFKVVILPNVSCMSEAQCEAVRLFIKNGGRIIATGDTSLFDESGFERPDFGLNDITGINFIAKREKALGQLKIVSDEYKPSLPWKTDILSFGSGQVEVKLLSGAEALGIVYKKSVTSPTCNALIPTEIPGLTKYVINKGLSYYFAGNPGLQYRLFGQHSIIDVMSKFLDITDAPVKLDASPSIELFGHKQKGKDNLVVSLVNAIGGVSRTAGNAAYSDRPGLIRFEEIDTMRLYANGVLTVKIPNGKKIESIYSVPDKKEMNYDISDDIVSIKIEKLTVHKMINIDFYDINRD